MRACVLAWHMQLKLIFFIIDDFLIKKKILLELILFSLKITHSRKKCAEAFAAFIIIYFELISIKHAKRND